MQKCDLWGLKSYNEVILNFGEKKSDSIWGVGKLLLGLRRARILTDFVVLERWLVLRMGAESGGFCRILGCPKAGFAFGGGFRRIQSDFVGFWGARQQVSPSQEVPESGFRLRMVVGGLGGI